MLGIFAVPIIPGEEYMALLRQEGAVDEYQKGAVDIDELVISPWRCLQLYSAGEYNPRSYVDRIPLYCDPDSVEHAWPSRELERHNEVSSPTDDVISQVLIKSQSPISTHTLGRSYAEP